jgi:integrase
MATIEKRTSSKGITSYRVRVRLTGEKQSTRTFKRLTDAKQWAAAAEADVQRGVSLPSAKERKRTLAELIDRYLSEQLPLTNKRDASRQQILLTRWKERAGHLSLERLTPEAVSGFRSQIAKRTKPNGERISGATVNRELAALSAVCKWGWKELRWLRENPVLAVSKASESTGIVRFLSDAERKALLAACKASKDPNIGTAVLLALATGARYSNLRNLTWPDVDLNRNTLRFTETKNGQPRYVPLVGAAQDALRAHRDRDPTQEGWVFKGSRDGVPADLDKPWRTLRKEAGLVGFRFHDLRHTTASYLTMNGASLAEVAEALGHRTLVMAKRYSHQSGEHVRSTLQSMADKFLTESG